MDALFGRLGALYPPLAVVVLLLPRSRLRALGAAGLALLALAAAALDVGVPRASNLAAFRAINASIALAGGLLIALSLLLALRRSATDSEASPATNPVLLPITDPWLLAGIALSWIAPQLILFGLAAVLVLVAAARAALRSSQSFPLLVLGFAALALASGVAVLLTILGPESAQLSRLDQAPVSLPAERLLTLLFGGAALLLAGVAPLHRMPWGSRLALFSAALLVRLVGFSFPLGLSTWQAVAMLLLLTAFSWAAITRRLRLAILAGGLFAAWAGPEAARSGTLLIAWAWLADGLDHSGGLLIAPRWRGSLVIPVALAALPALRAALRAQVLLPVTLVGVGLAALLSFAMRRPRLQQAPL